MKQLLKSAYILFIALIFFGCTTVGREGIAYTVEIVGAKDRSLKKTIKATAYSCTLQHRPSSTLGQLKRRMERDVPSIQAVLESHGYYDATVTPDLQDEHQPVRIVFQIGLGEQYRFRKVDVRFSGAPDRYLEQIKPLIRRNSNVVANKVFLEQQRIIELMKRKGYPFASLSKRRILVDRENEVIDLLLEFDPGVFSVFGSVEIDGLDELPKKFIHRQAPWKEGGRYDSRIVRDFETRLLSSGVFSSVQVSPMESETQTNSIPIHVHVDERSKRTIRLGVNYSDIGPGGRVFWEHRNLFGGGERLETSLSWTPIEKEGLATLTRSGFLDANQSLVLDFKGSRQDTDAYESKKARGVSVVLRDFTPRLQAGFGLGYQYSRVEQLSSDERYSHVLFPTQLMLDYRDDRLNPVSGSWFFGRATWFENTGSAGSFLKSELEARDYHLLWDSYRVSTAGRVTLGSIDGVEVDQVPADERFYAGGGGSIRGYEYQQVGPKLDGVPVGGDKLLECSAELRIQPGNRLGYVLFVDGGTVYNDLLNDTRSLRFGAGLGLRWFTTIGPLRADLAYPLNADDTQVERLQFYISLGQAF